MHHFEELASCFFGSRFDYSVFRRIAKVVHTVVLMVESAVKDPSSKASFREHALDERFEFDKTVIKFSRHRSLELELIRLETARC
jgi:hypothetical protein